MYVVIQLYSTYESYPFGLSTESLDVFTHKQTGA